MLYVKQKWTGFAKGNKQWLCTGNLTWYVKCKHKVIPAQAIKANGGTESSAQENKYGDWIILF